MPGFNPRVSRIRESPTRKIDEVREELSRKGMDIILLSTGQPSIPPPRYARERLARDLLEESMGLYSYTPTKGISSVRKAVLSDLEEDGLELGSGDLALTAGGQSALFATLSTLFREGDEVIVFDPMYFGYWPLLDYLGIRARVVPEDIEYGFQPDPSMVNEAITPGVTRGIILVTPDNPTGRVVEERVARELAEIAVDNGLWLVIDEAYRTLVYEGGHHYLYNYAPENVVALGAFSKDPGIPGWRLGYAYGPREAVKRISLIVQETVYCPPSVAQRLVEYYLASREKQVYREMVRKTYKARRDAAIQAVERYLRGARYVRPSGGMFLFVDLSPLDPKLDSEELARGLLRDKGVAVVPGVFFSKRYSRSLRLSFVSEDVERIIEGIRRIGEYLDLSR